jgi:hypothetical protein
MSRCYKRQKRTHRGTYRERDHIKMEAKIGVMQPQTLECQGPPEVMKNKEDSPQ